MNNRLILKPGREKSVRQRHPWIFSGAVAQLEGHPDSGDTVQVASADGKFLAWAAFSPSSQIRVRIWSWEERDAVGPEFLYTRLQHALDARKAMIPEHDTNAVRLVHGESDGLPGLIVDRYAEVLVVQILSAGVDHWRQDIIDALARLTGCKTIYERSDVDVRRLEGLSQRSGLLYGDSLSGRIEIEENSLHFLVDVQRGQKTGWYIDQRANRKRVGELVRGRKLLNCFCYTGGFSVYALAGGAESVLSVDSSADALTYATEHLRLNGLNSGQAEWLEGDVFQVLRGFRDEGRLFGAIVLDPPKFASTAAQAEKAARGYKDINWLAFRLLEPGGLLFTFSCSGGISADLFQKIVAGAAADAGVDARIAGYFQQGPDHPVALSFPEGAYLKGLICQVN